MTKTGGQRAAIIQAIRDMGGPVPTETLDENKDEAARRFWCEATEFLLDRLQQVLSDEANEPSDRSHISRRETPCPSDADT